MTAAKWLVAVAMVSIGLATPRLARADVVTVSVSGVSFNGNSVCGTSGTALCTETINASYQWDNATNTYVTGSFVASESGALGSSLSVENLPFVRFGDAVEFDLLGGNGDIFIDLVDDGSGLITGTYTVVADAFGAPLGDYSGDLECGTSPCSTDYPPEGPYAQGGAVAAGGSVVVSSAVAPTPEPSTMLLLGASLLAMAAVRRKRLA
jgi:hypothetical protein